MDKSLLLVPFLATFAVAATGAEPKARPSDQGGGPSAAVREFQAIAVQYIAESAGRDATLSITIQRNPAAGRNLRSITATYITQSIGFRKGPEILPLDVPGYYGDSHVNCTTGSSEQACASAPGAFAISARQVPLCGAEYPAESGWTIPCSRRPMAKGLVWVHLKWVFTDGSNGESDTVLRAAN